MRERRHLINQISEPMTARRLVNIFWLMLELAQMKWQKEVQRMVRSILRLVEVIMYLMRFVARHITCQRKK